VAEVLTTVSQEVSAQLPHLRILNGPQEGFIVPLDFGRMAEKPFVLGRSSEVDFLVHDPASKVSRRHSELSWRSSDEVLVLRDTSTNGTYLNEQMITSVMPLYPGDIIGCGTIKMLFAVPVPGMKTLLAQLPDEKHQPEDSWPGVARLDVLETDARDLKVGAFCRLNPQHTFTVGRFSDNDLQLLDEDVSRYHSEIRWVANGYVLRDVGAANSTLVNDKSLEKPRKLENGDEINFRGSVFIYRAPRMPYDSKANTKTETGPVIKVGTLRFALPNRELTLGPDLIALPFERQVQIGRAETNDLRLGGDRSVSRRHANIVFEAGRFILIGLTSTAGVQLNGQDIQRPVVLNNGNRIKIGQFEFLFEEKELGPDDSNYIPLRSGQPITLSLGEIKAGAGAADSGAVNNKMQTTTALHSPTIHPLRKFQPFDELDTDFFDKLVPFFKETNYRAGQEIAKEGNGRGAFFAIKSGTVTISRTLPDRRNESITLAEMVNGSIYGERTIFADQPFANRLVAKTDVTAFRLDEVDFQKSLASDRKILTFFQQQVATYSAATWLRGTILMRTLSDKTIREMAGRMRYRAFGVGETIAEKDKACDELFLIVGGQAEVFTTNNKGQRQVIARLQEGDTFGEGIAGEEEVYPMTVTARTLVDCYVLTKADFSSVLSQSAEPLASLGAEGLPINAILNGINPFTTMPPQLVAQIAARMKLKKFGKGRVIFKQGENADAFYIIHKGRVEVGFLTATGEYRTDMTLNPGQFFGESAISKTGNDTPKNTNTITATEDCELLTLYRPEFESVINLDKRFTKYLETGINKRYRPKRIADWTIDEQTNAQGEHYYLLGNGDSYFKLSEPGYFLWNLMDGDNSITDLGLAYFIEFKSLDIDGVSRIVAQLQAASFLEVAAIDEKLLNPEKAQQQSGLQKFGHSIVRVLNSRTELKNSDGIFTALYKYFGRVFFLKPVVWLMGLLIIAGIGAFVVQGGLGAILKPPLDSLLRDTWWLLIVTLLFNILIHETAHGLACKHYGRKVLGVGFGWQWVGPVFHVNTNEIWLEKRGPRIVVNLAGPIANILFCNICFLARLVTTDPKLQDTLFNMGVVAFTFAYINLTPLMELDGYYALMDWLEIPGLRKKALVHVRRWLTGKADVRPYTKREKIIFRWFVAAVPLYLVLIAVQFGFWFAGLTMGFLKDILGESVAAPIGWALAIVLTLVMALPLFAELFFSSKSAGDDDDDPARTNNVPTRVKGG